MSCFEKSSDRSNRERILPQTVTFFVDQTFQTALLFMLDLGELKSYSIVSGFISLAPNYSFCPMTKGDGGMP